MEAMIKRIIDIDEKAREITDAAKQACSSLRQSQL